MLLFTKTVQYLISCINLISVNCSKSDYPKDHILGCRHCIAHWENMLELSWSQISGFDSVAFQYLMHTSR